MQTDTTDVPVTLTSCSSSCNNSQPYAEISLEPISFLKISNDNNLKLIRHILNYGIASVISLVGTVGNIVNILVLRHHNLKKSSTLLLFLLTVSDLISSLLNAVSAAACVVEAVDPSLALTVDSIWTLYVFPINWLSFGTSNYIVTFIALERFTAVFFPLHVSRLIVPKRILLAVLIAFCVVFISMVPEMTSYVLVWDVDPSNNRTFATPVQRLFIIKDEYIFYMYVYYGLFIIIDFFPFITVIVCSVAICVKLTIARKKMKSSIRNPNYTRQDMKATKMLLVVCAAFTVIIVANGACRYAVLPLHSTSMEESSFIYLTMYAYSSLSALNASVNFFIYVTLSSRFARSYRELFCARCGK